MSTQESLKPTENGAMNVLKTVSESTTLAPPIPNAARSVLRFIEAIKELDSDNSEWRTLTAYVRDAVVEVIESMAKVGPSDRTTKEKFEKLDQAILKAIGEIEAEKAISDSERLQGVGQDHENNKNQVAVDRRNNPAKGTAYLLCASYLE
ncbi:hypothetical protein RhiJN_11848 [Ceratobasidium sp. AG-Ba]|nr:hypothetical protein RhiJN_11848 [Ceratobasidium sp. AG-Ba]